MFVYMLGIARICAHSFLRRVTVFKVQRMLLFWIYVPNNYHACPYLYTHRCIYIHIYMYAMQWDRKIVDLVEFLSCFTTFNNSNKNGCLH